MTTIDQGRVVAERRIVRLGLHGIRFVLAPILGDLTEQEVVRIEVARDVPQTRPNLMNVLAGLFPHAPIVIQPVGWGANDDLPPFDADDEEGV